VSNSWDADVARDDALFTRLIEAQFPALAPASLVLFGEGWDNYAYRVNDTMVFRLPRREVALGAVAEECRWLPILGPTLSLPIPMPRWFGRAAEGYPYDFAGYALLPGETSDNVTFNDAQRSGLAPALARFLRGLHTAPAHPDAPLDVYHRADLARGLPRLRNRLKRVESACSPVDGPAISALAEELVDTPPWDKPFCWVHGDLYPRHVLVDEEHAACGVIDWGDVHLGDPAVDLMLAWHLFGPADRARFESAYGGIDDATWRRARYRALQYGLTFLDYGHSIGDAAMTRMGRATLARVLEEGCEVHAA
jgi:aminoglycoside phosphotransferase (APT) family kinase protein